MQPREIPTWEFFNQDPAAAGPLSLGPLDKLAAGDRGAARLFIDALKGRSSVLDIGCGTGLPALYLAWHVDEMVAIDAAPSMVEAACDNAQRMKVTNVSFHVGGQDGLPFSDGAFDGASLCGVLESMDWEGVHRMMSEARRVLKPGARIATLDQDWQEVTRVKPPREATVRFERGRLMLQVVERSVSLHVERDTRYLVDPSSPTGQRIKAELAERTRVSTSLEAHELAPPEVLDAWYDEAAQFDAETLNHLMETYGFEETRVEAVPLWGGKVLFVTALKDA